MLLAAFVTFISFMLVLSHLGGQKMRRVVGYKGWADLVLHGSIMLLFIGTSTLGLLQAEAAGICFSLYLRAYYKFVGFECYDRKAKRWVRSYGPLGKLKFFN